MPNENSPDSKKQFINSIKEAYIKELNNLKGMCDSWALRRPIVALSGGPDSTALILAMYSVQSDLSAKIKACHINHNIRGEESSKDQKFVSDLCNSLGIELVVKELPPFENRIPSEDKLRKARYKALLEYANDIDSSIVLTGHTQDDQLETMLFRLFRGTALKGLCGISSSRELQENTQVFLLRPMLHHSKIDCLKFLAESEITARQDSSNDEVNYDRNYIRHQVIPKIESRFSQWNRSLSRLQELVSCEDDYFDQELNRIEDEIVALPSSDLTRVEINELGSLHKALQRRLIARILRTFGNEPSYERVNQVLELLSINTNHSCFTLSTNLEARRVNDNLEFRVLNDESSDERLEYLSRQKTNIRLPDVVGERQSTSNIITWLNKSLRIQRWQAEEEDLAKGFPGQREMLALVNLAGIKHPLVLRMRRPKDVIQPFGMKEAVKLKKYLHTHKPDDLLQMPAFQQELSTVIVLADQNEVLWVPGFGLSEKLRVTSLPTHKISLLDLSSGGPTFA